MLVFHWLKAGGFRLRLKARSVRHSADSGNVKLAARNWQRPVGNVVHPHLVRHIAASANPKASRPQVLALATLAQARKLAQQLVRTTPNQARLIDRFGGIDSKWT